jgi:hypothetical protein
MSLVSGSYFMNPEVAKDVERTGDLALKCSLNSQDGGEGREQKMPGALSDQIFKKILGVEDLYHRLVLVVAPQGGGKTGALQAVAAQTGARFVNVNLELAQRLLELTERERPLRVQRLLEELVAEGDASLVLLDNLEILFDPILRLDPLRSLQRLSRHRTIVAAWTGEVVGEDARQLALTYAEPGHPEHRRYAAGDLVIAGPSRATVS